MKKKSLFTFSVISIHIFALIWMMNGPSKTLLRKRERILVRTVQARPEPKSVRSSAAAVEKQAKQEVAASSAPPKKAAQQPQKTKPAPAKAPSSKAPAKKHAPAPAKKSPPKPVVSDALLEELEKNIEQATAVPKKEKKSIFVPPSAVKFEKSPASSCPPEDLLYQDLLIATFHEQLQLPEHGEVTLKVTIHKDGSVRKVAVVRAESAKNRAYLQEHLPLVHLPKPPPGTFAQDEHTFLITFSHSL